MREVIPVLAWRHPATLAPEALHIGFATDGEIIRSRSGVGQICSHFNNSFVGVAVAVVLQPGLIILYKHTVYFSPPFGQMGVGSIVPLF